MKKLFAYALSIVLASALVGGAAEAKPRHHAKTPGVAVARQATVKKVSFAKHHPVKKHRKAHRRAK